MSYILDALKKSEQERKKGKVPGLDTIQDFSTKKKRVARPPWLLIIVAAFALNALLFGIWTYSEQSSTPDLEVVATTSDESETTVTPSEAKDMPATEAKQSDNIPAEIAVEETTEQSALETPVQTDEFQASPQPESENILPDVEAEQVVADTTDQQPQIPVEESPAIDEETENAEGMETNEPIPFDDLSSGIRSSLPGIRISIHYYSSDRTSRKVSINGRMMREGGRVEQGLIVEEITREGVIFSYEGTLFSYDVFFR